MFLICCPQKSWFSSSNHVFTNSESTNPRFFFHEIFLGCFKNKVEFFYWDQKFCYNCWFSQKRHFCSSFKRKQDIFPEEKSWIRRFGIRENMSRTNYNLRFWSWNAIIYSLSLWSQNKFHYWSVRNRYRLQQAMRHFLEIKIWPRYVAQVAV